MKTARDVSNIKINGFRVYRPWKNAQPKAHKPSPLLDTWDKMIRGDWMVCDLSRARLVRAMLERRDYGCKQVKIREGQYRMVKV